MLPCNALTLNIKNTILQNSKKNLWWIYPPHLPLYTLLVGGCFNKQLKTISTVNIMIVYSYSIKSKIIKFCQCECVKVFLCSGFNDCGIYKCICCTQYTHRREHGASRSSRGSTGIFLGA